MTAAHAHVAQPFRAGPPARPARRIAIVHGNCQAESLRRLLPPGELHTVRVPPVHELEAGDVELLHRWLARASILVTQPIRRGYRGLAIGTADVITAAPDAAVVLVPVIHFAGLYPEHVTVRPPGDPGAVPPLVPYHSLRTLAVAAGRRLRALTPAAVRSIARRSIAELSGRERRHGTVVVSDLFAAPSFSLMRTINHPGNPVLVGLGARVCDRLGVPPVPPPARPLLDSVHAPRLPAVIRAFGLDAAPTRSWTVDGASVDPDAVHAAHLAWYAERPGAVAAGLERHRDVLATIGTQ